MPEEGPVAEERLRLHLLVLRCQAGDDEAFTHLFQLFARRTLSYLEGLVGDDADDVQQEVWLSVYRNLGGLANPGAFRTWLFQTTRYRALDSLRRRKRQSRLLDDAATELAQGDVPAGDEDERVGDLDLAAIAEALPPTLREVLLLRYGNDLSYAEVALVMGCAVGTVRSRLHAARHRARQLIEGSR
jgi:RNA polymerase sigma factor, sigma-70 family